MTISASRLAAVSISVCVRRSTGAETQPAPAWPPILWYPTKQKGGKSLSPTNVIQNRTSERYLTIFRRISDSGHVTEKKSFPAQYCIFTKSVNCPLNHHACIFSFQLGCFALIDRLFELDVVAHLEMPEFIAVQCFSCQTFQAQQRKKVQKFACVVCTSKQSVIKAGVLLPSLPSSPFTFCFQQFPLLFSE